MLIDSNALADEPTLKNMASLKRYSDNLFIPVNNFARTTNVPELTDVDWMWPLCTGFLRDLQKYLALSSASTRKRLEFTGEKTVAVSVKILQIGATFTSSKTWFGKKKIYSVGYQWVD